MRTSVFMLLRVLISSSVSLVWTAGWVIEPGPERDPGPLLSPDSLRLSLKVEEMVGLLEGLLVREEGLSLSRVVGSLPSA